MGRLAHDCEILDDKAKQQTSFTTFQVRREQDLNENE